jgi:O-antigen/teichoic acid export membrane protein
LFQKITKDTTKAYQSLQAFRLGASILLSIVLVKLAFTKTEIGNFEWFLFLTNALSFFWSMGLLNAFKSYFPLKTKEEKASLISNLALIFLCFGIIVVTGLYFSSYGKELISQGNWTYFSVFLVLGISASINEHILIVKEKSISLFNYGLVSYITYFVGLSIVAFWFHNINYLFAFLAFWALLRFIYGIFLVNLYGSWTWNFSSGLKFVAYSFPLIVHVLLGGGMEYVDGYLVDVYYSRDEFTLFRYGARELPINTIFITAMVATMIPLAVSNLDLTLVDLKARLNKLMHWLFPSSIILVLISPLIFQAVYNEGFLKSAFVFNIYLLILCSRLVLPQVILYAKQKNSVLMWVGLLELLVNIGLSLYLIQDYGILGIAFATVIAYIVQKVALVIYCKTKLNVNLSEYLDTNIHMLYSALLYSVFVISFYIYS